MKIFFPPLLLFIMFFSSCNKTLSYQEKEELLLSKTWLISTYINSETNESLIEEDFTYTFSSDGTLSKTLKSGSIIESKWELIYDGDYIEIGNNTYKILELTKKTFIIRLGTIEMYFVTD
jgi:hypothetical protein